MESGRKLWCVKFDSILQAENRRMLREHRNCIKLPFQRFPLQQQKIISFSAPYEHVLNVNSELHALSRVCV